MKPLTNKTIFFLSIFFVLYGAFAMFYGIYRGHPSWIFWFCYIGMILIGIGGLRKDLTLITSQFNILLFPLIFWNIDFFITLFTGSSKLGIAGYFFEEMLILARLISFEHLFLIPLTLVILFLLIKDSNKNSNLDSNSNKDSKSKNSLNRIKYSFIISFIQILLTFIVMNLLKASEDNVNCVFENCYNFLNFFLPFASYPILWFLFYFSMILASNLIIYGIIKILVNYNKIHK